MAKFGEHGINDHGGHSLLKVEIIGYGEMRTLTANGEEQSHLLYVISVQQQQSAWTVILLTYSHHPHLKFPTPSLSFRKL
jgi:hypothetical protein